MIFGVCTHPCVRKFFIFGEFTQYAQFWVLFKSKFVLWPALPMKILHFGTRKCPISGPILVLMFEYMMGGWLYGPLRKKILY